MLRQGRSHVGALIAKGDRDFATAVEISIEEAVRRLLAAEVPGIPLLGEEEEGATLDEGVLWVLDPIDGTVNFTRDSLLCAISLALVEDGQPSLAVVDLPLLGRALRRSPRRRPTSTASRRSESLTPSPRGGDCRDGGPRGRLGSPSSRTASTSSSCASSRCGHCESGCTARRLWTSPGWPRAGSTPR
ncbi:MAG: inositol monophosphatase [Solirubrobacterales bacterium]|jgi:hypothetical protein|nr:inositol monophosphatase [Solirubrobacterales bacterium]